MQINTKYLIKELLAITDKATAAAERFKNLDNAQLNFKQTATEWSILECLEHLNRYGNFYLPEMQDRILADNSDQGIEVFKASIIGNYFANLMKLQNGEVKKLKTPKDKNPLNSELTTTTIHRFLRQLELLRSILNRAEVINIRKIKTAISLTSLIKLRLGDTLRFYVYHIERHIMQAERVLKAQQISNTTAIKEPAKTALSISPQEH